VREVVNNPVTHCLFFDVVYIYVYIRHVKGSHISSYTVYLNSLFKLALLKIPHRLASEMPAE